MYIEKIDFISITDLSRLNKITGSDDAVWQACLPAAMEEAAGYLRSRYDIEIEYSRTGEARNAKLVQIICAIIIVHLHLKLSGQDVPQYVIELRDHYTKWLKEIQASKQEPNLPMRTDVNKNSGMPIIVGEFTSINHSSTTYF